MNQNYNKCSKGHKFCSKCGELWHQVGKCPEEENIDKLFEEYSKKLNLKKYPNLNYKIKIMKKLYL